MRPTSVQLGKASSGVIFVKQKAQKSEARLPSTGAFENEKTGVVVGCVDQARCIHEYVAGLDDLRPVGASIHHLLWSWRHKAATSVGLYGSEMSYALNPAFW